MQKYSMKSKDAINSFRHQLKQDRLCILYVDVVGSGIRLKPRSQEQYDNEYEHSVSWLRVRYKDTSRLLLRLTYLDCVLLQS